MRQERTVKPPDIICTCHRSSFILVVFFPTYISELINRTTLFEYFRLTALIKIVLDNMLCIHNRLILIVTMKNMKNNIRITSATQIRWIKVDRSVWGLHLGRGSAFAINDSSSCSHQPTICSRSVH